MPYTGKSERVVDLFCHTELSFDDNGNEVNSNNIETICTYGEVTSQ